ncbi:DUF2780 domain-containing protein [Mangrovitalea sediminis]|uniref:DUF2780 domain-containing protein n=1 Tax=Mangrovitalea sediminis TaxID=1982043 RepID=UPI000BE50A4D|nr:DUF2780 domain-containing protein [Mangrovitalea sediminis]
MSPLFRSSLFALGIVLTPPALAGSFLDSASKALDSASQMTQNLSSNTATTAPTTRTSTTQSLTDLAMSSLGVGNSQATSGLGVLFGLAQQNLTGNQFQTVSQSVPQMSALLSAGKQATEQAQKSNASGGLLGNALSMASQVSPTAGTALKAYNTMKNLGFTPEQIGSLINLVTQYLQGAPSANSASSKSSSAADLFQQGVSALASQPGVTAK